MRSRNLQSYAQSGFTIIELTLAMTFLAFVMIFSATVVVQLTNTYSKGLTIKQINQAGRSITDDLSRSLQLASVTGVELSNVSNGYICVGESAYIWNPLYTDDSGTVNTAPDTYKLGGKPLSLARVEASAVGECTGAVSTNINPDVSNTSLLSGNARVVYAEATKSTADPRLVKVQFLLGTYSELEKTALLAGTTNELFNTVYHDGTKYACRVDRFGNFCSLAEFATTVYVSR